MATSGLRLLGTVIMVSWRTVLGVEGVLTGADTESLCTILRRFLVHP
jgi:hypothetical protein